VHIPAETMLSLWHGPLSQLGCENESNPAGFGIEEKHMGRSTEPRPRQWSQEKPPRPYAVIRPAVVARDAVGLGRVSLPVRIPGALGGVVAGGGLGSLAPVAVGLVWLSGARLRLPRSVPACTLGLAIVKKPPSQHSAVNSRSAINDHIHVNTKSK
jgi:hypothetical protein